MRCWSCHWRLARCSDDCIEKCEETQERQRLVSTLLSNVLARQLRASCSQAHLTSNVRRTRPAHKPTLPSKRPARQLHAPVRGRARSVASTAPRGPRSFGQPAWRADFPGREQRTDQLPKGARQVGARRSCRDANGVVGRGGAELPSSWCTDADRGNPKKTCCR